MVRKTIIPSWSAPGLVAGNLSTSGTIRPSVIAGADGLVASISNILFGLFVFTPTCACSCKAIAREIKNMMLNFLMGPGLIYYSYFPASASRINSKGVYVGYPNSYTIGTANIATPLKSVFYTSIRGTRTCTSYYCTRHCYV